MNAGNEEYSKFANVERLYRELSAPDLLKYRICVGESDLMILAQNDYRTELTQKLKHYRRQLKQYIHSHPGFVETLTPLPSDLSAPELVGRMNEAAILADVGPMAAVAGAIAEMLGRNTGLPSDELIVENGGDIYLRSMQERIIAVYAGGSPFSNRIGLRFAPQPEGLGICTSAGTVGPSLSFGKADAIVIVAPNVALADAVATATGNRVQTPRDFETALRFAQNIPGVQGILIIKEDQLTAWGEIELVPLE